MAGNNSGDNQLKRGAIGGIALVLNVTKNRQLTQIDSSRRFYSSYAKYTK